MTTPPVFSVGQYNTAAYMNSIGLWLVKTQTVAASPAVSSVTVTDAFSADYDNYRIIFTGLNTTAGYSLYMSFNNRTGTTYATGGRYTNYGAASGDGTSATDTGFWLGVMGTNHSGVIDVYRPATANPCSISMISTSATYGNTGNGYNSVSAASTSFTMFPAYGTISGGTIRVYGYRN